MTDLSKLILAATACKDLDSALLALGVDSGLGPLELTQDWFAAGSETYALRFTGGGSHFIAKACAPSLAAAPVYEIARRWSRRRQAVADAAIQTPRVFASAGPSWIEEWIPFKLGELLADRRNIESWSERQTVFAQRLSSAGFNPVSLHDLRSRGDDIVMIDFGADLGDASNNRVDPNRILSLMQ